MNTPFATSESRTIKTIETSFSILSLPFFIMGLLLPIYGKELGASVFEIGVIFSAFSVMTILMRPLVGWAFLLCELILLLFLQIPRRMPVKEVAK